MKDKTVPVRMSEALHGLLCNAAEQAEVPLSQFIREAAKKAAEVPCKRCEGTGVELAKKARKR
jgi:uncharacterized protein (DUF1778 family)